MQASTTAPIRLDLFCKVVDNYGDIGICWRLSKQFAHEHHIQVRLWVDDLLSFQRICPDVNPTLQQQTILGIEVVHWNETNRTFTENDIADIVIEFFACDIPAGYIHAMSKLSRPPVWFNLEGLTAEEWVEGCHTLSSPHPSYSLTKYFFFPGFTSKTGGLICEQSLLDRRNVFLSHPHNRTVFLKKLGLSESEIQGKVISLFCYPQAPIQALFDTWINSKTPITCLIPEGVAQSAVDKYFAGINEKALLKGSLTLRIIPFIPQPEYDQLLWSCDLNFVRGEDSFVRAQWAAKPFIWHIYPQDENLHHKKLNAFLKRYAPSITSLQNLSLIWNDAMQFDASAQNWLSLWETFQSNFPQIIENADSWQIQMLENGDLTSNLVQFAETIRKSPLKME
jgi:uncharacterized repeat protein (TIGR03837 family)